MNSSCNCKDDDCIKKSYRFQISSRISPQLDTLRIGDTIQISLEYPRERLINLNTNNEIAIGNFDMGIGFGVTDFTDTVDNFGITTFDVLPNVGELILVNLVGTSIYEIKFEGLGDYKKSTFSLIPNKKGKFLFAFSTTIDNDQKEEVNIIGDPCGEYIEEIAFKINDGVENGYNLYVSNIGAPYSDVTFDEYTDSGAYAFVVME